MQKEKTPTPSKAKPTKADRPASDLPPSTGLDGLLAEGALHTLCARRANIWPNKKSRRTGQARWTSGEQPNLFCPSWTWLTQQIVTKGLMCNYRIYYAVQNSPLRL
mmetsp:Transcript_102329/g.176737  ORF Transcript_102329/g.176737 Transcript_102329/m.176737 type:complete len:106 (-) Transcript_102329:18-335(-)